MDLAGIPISAWTPFLTTWDLISVARVSTELRTLVHDEADPPAPGGVVDITGRVPYGRYLKKIFSRVQLTLSSHALEDDEVQGLDLVALDCGFRLSDTGIATLTNLQYLTLYGYNNQITDAGLQKLQRVTYLDIGPPSKMRITDVGLSSLRNLVSLKIEKIDSDYSKLTDHGLSGLTNLIYLNVGSGFTDEGIRHLVNLVHLQLHDNKVVTGTCFPSLTCLTTLGLGGCSGIRDENLCQLSNLTALDLFATEGITDRGIMALTRLTWLNLGRTEGITDDGLWPLTGLTDLDISLTRGITGSCLQRFCLRTLGLRGGTDVRDSALCGIKVKTLDLCNNDTITDEGLLSVDPETLKCIYAGSLTTTSCVDELERRGVRRMWWHQSTGPFCEFPRPPVGSRRPKKSPVAEFALFGD